MRRAAGQATHTPSTPIQRPLLTATPLFGGATLMWSDVYKVHGVSGAPPGAIREGAGGGRARAMWWSIGGGMGLLALAASWCCFFPTAGRLGIGGVWGRTGVCVEVDGACWWLIADFDMF